MYFSSLLCHLKARNHRSTNDRPLADFPRATPACNQGNHASIGYSGRRSDSRSWCRSGRVWPAGSPKPFHTSQVRQVNASSRLHPLMAYTVVPYCSPLFIVVHKLYFVLLLRGILHGVIWSLVCFKKWLADVEVSGNPWYPWNLQRLSDLLKFLFKLDRHLSSKVNIFQRLLESNDYEVYDNK